MNGYDALMAVENPSQSRRRAIVKTLLYIEALIVAAIALWLVFLTITHEDKEFAPLIGEFVFTLFLGVGLYICGRAFGNGKNYGRAPSILINAIFIGVAYYQVQASFWITAIPLLLIASAIIYFALRIIPE